MSDQFPTAGASRFDAATIVTLVSSALLLVGSFLSFYELDLGLDSTEEQLGSAFFGGLETSWKVWSDAWSLFPLLTIVVLLPVLAAVLLVLDQVGTAAPGRLASIEWRPVRLLLGVIALVTVAAYVLRSFLTSDDDFVSLGIGAWVVLVGVVGYVVGAAMARPADQTGPEAAPAAGTGSRFSAPWALVTLASAAVTVVGSFLPVLGAAEGLGGLAEGSESENAWADGLRPVFGLPAIAAVIVVVLLLVGEGVWANARGRLGITASAARWAFSGLGVVAALGLVLGNPVFGAFSNIVDVKYGLYLMLLGAVGMLGGCLMHRMAAATPTQPPTSF